MGIATEGISKADREKIFQFAVFWRDKEKALEENAVIVIIDSDDDEVNKMSIDLLPLFMGTNCFDKVTVFSSCIEIVENINCSGVDTIVLNREWLLGFNKCQRLLGSYSKIFTNITEYLDDGNPFLLVDSYDLSKADIVEKVIYDINPFAGSKKREYNPVIDPKIESSLFNKYIPLDRYRYRTIREFLEKKTSELENDGYINKNNHIFVYGDSYSGLQIVDLLQSEYTITIVDKDSQKCGKKRGNVTITSPETALIPYNSNNRILIAIYSFREVCEYLYDMGYELGKEIFLLNYKEDIRDYDNESLLQKVKYISKKGEEAYTSIRGEFPNEHILLSPWSGTGDLYLAGLYLDEFTRKHGIDDFVIVSSSKSAGKIAKLLGYYKVIIIEQEEAFYLLALSQVFTEYYSDISLINLLAPKQRMSRLSKIVDTNTYLQRAVFGTKTRHTVVSIEQTNADCYFKKFSLQKGKTALIAPYSVTSKYIPIEICNYIVDRLLEQGYNVCTNIGTGEEALDRTLGLQLPYDCIIDFVNKAGLFIGIRSGLCDIISSTSAEMVVFYQPETYDLYSLKRMGLKTENIIEVVIDGSEGEAIKDYLK